MFSEYVHAMQYSKSCFFVLGLLAMYLQLSKHGISYEIPTQRSDITMHCRHVVA